MLLSPSLKQTLIELKLSGTLNRNTPESNRQAIREMLAHNSYWTFGSEAVAGYGLTYDKAAAIMAAALGMTVKRFASDEVCFIDPDMTVRGLTDGLERLQTVARDGGRILLATSHPGSMLGFYTVIGRYLVELGGELVVPEAPVPAVDNRWIDAVDGVLVLSDEGNLMHTHDGMGMKELIQTLKPDIVMSDHGFAMAAINASVSTVAIFDVDDPALAIEASANPENIIGVPMNDNQTNIRSAVAARCLVSLQLARA
jgi:hypothetical protein